MEECRFCDLDSTLIFSHRHEIGEKVVVEYLKDKEQSYMQANIYEIFRSVGSRIVPLTSRTCSQYNRIIFPIYPEYALIDNGGILLKNGEIDEAWREETIAITAEDISVMRLIEPQLEKYGKIKWQDDLVLFLKLVNSDDTCTVNKIVEEYNLLFFEHGAKKYICSRAMNKGMAIKRFKERFIVKKAYMAGDSLVDYATAPFVDALYLPKELMNKVPFHANVSYVDKLDLAEKILRGC
ncbi:MAG: hypothetical protein K2G45_02430 [Lachnospiraceae bacterium]|nr:hypothetical protein [Lachnospiraceae bacterium]